MRLTSVRAKAVPKTSPKPWVSALVWLLFCAAMVAVALFLTSQIGAAYASDHLPQANDAVAGAVKH